MSNFTKCLWHIHTRSRPAVYLWIFQISQKNYTRCLIQLWVRKSKSFWIIQKLLLETLYALIYFCSIRRQFFNYVFHVACFLGHQFQSKCSSIPNCNQKFTFVSRVRIFPMMCLNTYWIYTMWFDWNVTQQKRLICNQRVDSRITESRYENSWRVHIMKLSKVRKSTKTALVNFQKYWKFFNFLVTLPGGSKY